MIWRWVHIFVQVWTLAIATPYRTFSTTNSYQITYILYLYTYTTHIGNMRAIVDRISLGCGLFFPLCGHLFSFLTEPTTQRHVVQRIELKRGQHSPDDYRGEPWHRAKHRRTCLFSMINKMSNTSTIYPSKRTSVSFLCWLQNTKCIDFSWSL
jgi:hypothetical protein